VNLTIKRTYGDFATTGTCQVGGRSLFTIELPWKDNESGVSCVPEGVYDLVPYESPTHGPTWVLSAPGFTRSYCELHSGNWSEQLEGCIAFGMAAQPMYDPYTGKVGPALEESKDAIAYLIETLGSMSTGHTLSIGR
jgi:hypothetical protein